MSWSDGSVPELHFQGYDKLWQVAGWVVFQDIREDKIVQTIACHHGTGQIVKIFMRDGDGGWKQQTCQRLMEVRT